MNVRGRELWNNFAKKYPHHFRKISKYFFRRLLCSFVSKVDEKNIIKSLLNFQNVHEEKDNILKKFIESLPWILKQPLI